MQKPTLDPHTEQLLQPLAALLSSYIGQPTAVEPAPGLGTNLRAVLRADQLHLMQMLEVAARANGIHVIHPATVVGTKAMLYFACDAEGALLTAQMAPRETLLKLVDLSERIQAGIGGEYPNMATFGLGILGTGYCDQPLAKAQEVQAWLEQQGAEILRPAFEDDGDTFVLFKLASF